MPHREGFLWESRMFRQRHQVFDTWILLDDDSFRINQEQGRNLFYLPVWVFSEEQVAGYLR